MALHRFRHAPVCRPPGALPGISPDKPDKGLSTHPLQARLCPSVKYTEKEAVFIPCSDEGGVLRSIRLVQLIKGSVKMESKEIVRAIDVGSGNTKFVKNHII